MLQKAKNVRPGSSPKQILPSEDIHLWLTRLSWIKDEQVLQKYVSCLNEEEQAEMNRFAFEEVRRRYVVSRVLLRWVIARYADVAMRDVQFEYNEYGRPRLPEHLNRLDLRFNVSHHGDYVLVGLTKKHDIGADIEKVEGRSDLSAIAERFFAQSEIDDLQSVTEDRRVSRFYDYWTLKEAYIKARGKGLSIPPADVSFLIRNNAISLSSPAESDGDPEEWKFWLIDCPDEYRIAIALCTGEEDVTGRLKLFSTKPFSDESQEDLWVRPS